MWKIINVQTMRLQINVGFVIEYIFGVPQLETNFKRGSRFEIWIWIIINNVSLRVCVEPDVVSY